MEVFKMDKEEFYQAMSDISDFLSVNESVINRK